MGSLCGWSTSSPPPEQGRDQAAVAGSWIPHPWRQKQLDPGEFCSQTSRTSFSPRKSPLNIPAMPRAASGVILVQTCHFRCRGLGKCAVHENLTVLSSGIPHPSPPLKILCNLHLELPEFAGPLPKPALRNTGEKKLKLTQSSCIYSSGKNPLDFLDPSELESFGTFNLGTHKAL